MIDGLKVHLSTYLYRTGQPCIDGVFEYAADANGDWNGNIWRVLLIANPLHPELLTPDEPGWAHLPGSGDRPPLAAPPPPVVLAAYHAHKDELLALMIAERMKG